MALDNELPLNHLVLCCKSSSCETGLFGSTPETFVPFRMILNNILDYCYLDFYRL